MNSIVSMMTESDITSPTSTTPSSSDLSGSRKLDEKMAYRKSNKPMMEKKRRARINSCLTQLKALVLQAMKKDNSQYSKLEKADILELTVKHLKNVQRLQNGLATPQVPDAVTKYRAGFNECANEVMRYLGQTQDVNNDARTRILSHLATILTPINSLPLQQSHTPILPAPPMSAAPSASSSSSSSSSELQLHQQQQQQQSHILQQALQNHQPQQDQHLHRRQQTLLASEALVLSQERVGVGDKGSLNTQPAIGQICHLTRTGNTPPTELHQVITTSPTAFQSPVVNSMPKSSTSGLQLSCIATTPAAMAQGRPLQFVPSALPTGQVTFVLTPQPIPPMNVYTPSVIAASSTVSPEFAMSVLGQQQQQQRQQQQQQQQQQILLKQEEQRQLAVTSAKRPAANDFPISLVIKQSKLSKDERQISTPMLDRSTSSPSPPSSSPSSISSSTPSSHLDPPPSSSGQNMPPSIPSYTTHYSYRDGKTLPTLKTAIPTPDRTFSTRDNFENLTREDNSEPVRNTQRIDQPQFNRRVSGEDNGRENIENSRRELPIDVNSFGESFPKPNKTSKGDNFDLARRRRMNEVHEQEMDMSTRKRLQDFDGVIDYRLTKCSSEVKVKGRPSTWRPW